MGENGNVAFVKQALTVPREGEIQIKMRHDGRRQASAPPLFSDLEHDPGDASFVNHRS